MRSHGTIFLNTAHMPLNIAAVVHRVSAISFTFRMASYRRVISTCVLVHKRPVSSINWPADRFGACYRKLSCDVLMR